MTPVTFRFGTPPPVPASGAGRRDVSPETGLKAAEQLQGASARVTSAPMSWRCGCRSAGHRCGVGDDDHDFDPGKLFTGLPEPELH
jgi:hypothetical protein